MMKLLSDQVTEIKYLNELPKGIKLNIGSGFKRIEGYLNVDDDPLVEPDVNVHLDDVNLVLPFDNDSVSVVHAHHILEHIGDGFIRLFQELYRVCKNGAIIDILVPHHTHENFFGDVTHKRPITPNAMMQFGKKYCQNSIDNFYSSSGVAFKYNVDFEMVDYDFEYDSFYADMIANYKQRKQAGETSQEEDFMVTRLCREGLNVAMHTKMILKVIK